MEQDTCKVSASGYPTVEVTVPVPETVGEFDELVDDVEQDVPALAARAWRISLQSSLRNAMKSLVDDEGFDGDELADALQSQAEQYVYGQRPTASKGTVDVSDVPEAQTAEGQALLERLAEQGYNVKGLAGAEA